MVRGKVNKCRGGSRLPRKEGGERYRLRCGEEFAKLIRRRGSGEGLTILDCLSTPKPAEWKFAIVLCIVVGLLLGFLVARRHRSAATKIGNVLLFLLGRLQNLWRAVSVTQWLKL